VLVTPEGRVVILDFGLVADLERHSGAEQGAAGIVGTYAYMAPEQVLGKPLTAASDWYSVGVMLYKTITGRLLISNGMVTMTRSFSCSAYNVLCGASISPTSSDLTVGDSVGWWANYAACIGYNAGSCSGPSGGSAGPDYSWSGGGGVVDVSGCGDSASCSGTGTNTGNGTVTVSVYTTSPGYCAFSASSNVTGTPTVTIQGSRRYVYLGHDANVIQNNVFFGQGNPAGGTYTWSSPSTYISFDNPNAQDVHVTATNYTGGINDTKIALDYTQGGQAATQASVNVTQRLFYFLAGDSLTLYASYNGPSQYGYTYYAYYNVFTHPDGGQVTDGSGFGTYENVTQTSSNASVSPHFGQGALDANSRVVDLLQLTNSTALPANLSIVYSQDIGVGGFYNRNNTLTFTATGVTVQSNGPSN